MNTKKIIIAFIGLSIALNFTACANNEEAYSEEELAKEKEAILTLLDSEKTKDIIKGIDRSNKFGLQADLEIGKEMIGLLDDVQSDIKTLDALLEYIANIPKEEKDLLVNDILAQYESAAKNGSIDLRDGIFQVIRFGTFSADKEKKEAYDTWMFTKSNGRTLDVARDDPALFNQLWVIGAKFGNSSDIRIALGSRNAFEDITAETKLDLFAESINKIPTMLRNEEEPCNQFENALLSINDFEMFLSNPENTLSQGHVDILERVLGDDIFQQENLLSSCNYPSLDQGMAASYTLRMLALADPQMTCNANMTFLENTATINTNLDSRTERYESYLESAKNSATQQLIACEGKTRDQFLLDYFNDHSGTNSYFANIAMERELTAMGSTDHAQALAEFIQSLLDSDWETVEHYELYGYFEEEENAPYKLFIGPVIDDLYKLDNDLGMEAALQLLSNEKITGGYSEVDLATIYKYYILALENDEIVDFFVQFINNNEIDVEKIAAIQSDEFQSDQTAYFRLMQSYRELNVKKDEVISFFVTLLDTNDHTVRIHVARLLQNELEVDIDYFSDYFDSKDLAVIAGAYEYAYEVLDKDILIEALNEYGDSTMANAYLNDHGGALSAAAKTWAEDNGYEIIEFEIPTFEFD